MGPTPSTVIIARQKAGDHLLGRKTNHPAMDSVTGCYGRLGCLFFIVGFVVGVCRCASTGQVINIDSNQVVAVFVA